MAEYALQPVGHDPYAQALEPVAHDPWFGPHAHVPLVVPASVPKPDAAQSLDLGALSERWFPSEHSLARTLWP